MAAGWTPGLDVVDTGERLRLRLAGVAHGDGQTLKKRPTTSSGACSEWR
jgi:hypothetical protein